MITASGLGYAACRLRIFPHPAPLSSLSGEAEADEFSFIVQISKINKKEKKKKKRKEKTQYSNSNANCNFLFIDGTHSPASRDALDDFFKVVRRSSPALSLREILGGWVASGGAGAGAEKEKEKEKDAGPGGSNVVIELRKSSHYILVWLFVFHYISLFLFPVW